MFINVLLLIFKILGGLAGVFLIFFCLTSASTSFVRSRRDLGARGTFVVVLKVKLPPSVTSFVIYAQKHSLIILCLVYMYLPQFLVL